ncbi:MAG: GNAT family N-acetyltransferase [Promethearchaeota archaeon]
MTEVKIVLANKADEWNNYLVERNPYASAYHLWEWGEALSFTYGYQKYYLTATHTHDVVGLFPLVHVKSRIFGNRLISLPFCGYGGPLADPELGDQEMQLVLEALLDATGKLAETLGVQYVESRNPSPEVTRDSITVKGYRNIRKYVTFRVNLEMDLQEVWSNLHRKTRNALRKAIRSGVKTKDVRGTEELESYYRLYLQTQRRHGTPPHNYKLFERLYDVFGAKGKLKMLLAEYMGRPIAGVMMFRQDKTLFWWNNVTDTKHRSLNPTNLLLWNTIEWGVRNRYHALDLGRTREGTTIHRFKSRWGGRERYLRDYVYFLDSKEKELPDPLQRKYRYLSKIWFFMPTGLAKKIGPRIRGDAGL